MIWRDFGEFTTLRRLATAVVASARPCQSPHTLPVSVAAFDEIMRAGRAAVLTGRHRVEGPPSETGRWGPSAVVLASGELARTLDQLADDAADVAGGVHWRTGGDGRGHATVRALEPHSGAAPDAAVSTRYVTALQRASAGIGPIALEFDGIVLAPASIMVTGRSPDGAADELRRRLGEELGTDGWLEDAVFDRGRDPIWYCTILHFAGPIDRPSALVDWVERRRHADIGRESFDSVTLCTWSFDGIGMRPECIARVPM